MLKIGFVDYDLSRSHADRFVQVLRADHGDAVSVETCWGMVSDASQRWAGERGVAWGDSAAAVAAASDAVMILSPNNPEHHLRLAEEVFPAASRVFIDKTFADIVAHAHAIERLARKEETLYFSSSALRYAPALVEAIHSGQLDDAVDIEMRGPGRWDNYGVHVVEPVIRTFGRGVRRMRAGGHAKIDRVELEWDDGRTAYLCVNGLANPPFEMRVTTPKGLTTLDLRDPAYYNRLMDTVVGFFQRGQPPVDFSETEAIVGIVSGMTSARENGGWIDL